MSNKTIFDMGKNINLDVKRMGGAFAKGAVVISDFGISMAYIAEALAKNKDEAMGKALRESGKQILADVISRTPKHPNCRCVIGVDVASSEESDRSVTNALSEEDLQFVKEHPFVQGVRRNEVRQRKGLSILTREEQEMLDADDMDVMDVTTEASNPDLEDPFGIDGTFFEEEEIQRDLLAAEIRELEEKLKKIKGTEEILATVTEPKDLLRAIDV